MDLAPDDFYLDPTFKRKLKGRRFKTVREPQMEVDIKLQWTSHNGLDHVFTQWEK